jgi:hypothetical protein
LLGAIGGGHAWLASLQSPASVDLVGTPATFNKPLVKGFIVFAGSGLRW